MQRGYIARVAMTSSIARTSLALGLGLISSLGAACSTAPARSPSTPEGSAAGADAKTGHEADTSLTPPPAFTLADGAQHPLTGMIWSRASGRLITPETLVEQLRRADHVLLGEIHDNPDHHRLQAWLIEQLAVPADGRAPRRVVFEQLDAMQVERARAQVSAELPPAQRAQAWSDAVEWSASGWPRFELYAPIFVATFTAGLEIEGAGLPREALAPLFRGEPVEPELAARFGLDQPLTADVRTSWLEEMAVAHCGAMPPEALAPMLDAQRLRDAKMADTMLRAERTVLIAGRGHTRADRAVPAYLERSPGAARAGVAGLAFVEVETERRAVEDYAPLEHAFVWFTPRASRPDPCEAFRKTHAPPAEPSHD